MPHWLPIAAETSAASSSTASGGAGLADDEPAEHAAEQPDADGQAAEARE